MFPNSTCPVCHRPATTACGNCGLRAVAFHHAVHEGVGELALAWILLQSGVIEPSDPRVLWPRHAAKFRDSLRAHIGVFADHLRKKRGHVPVAQAKHSALETELHSFAMRDPFMHLPLKEITPEAISAVTDRYRKLTEQEEQVQLHLPSPPPMVDMAGADEQRAMLTALKKAGISRLDHLHRLITPTVELPATSRAKVSPPVKKGLKKAGSKRATKE